MKRKQASNAAASATVRPAKKVRGDALPWKSIDFGPDIEGANMLLGFEEVDGVTVEYSQDGLKTANFLVKDTGSPEPPSDPEEAEWVPLSTESDAEEAAPEASTSSSKLGSIDNSPFQKSLLPAFTHLHLCPALRRSLHKLQFKDPTPIQQGAWKVALPDETSVATRDIIGVAETGSGKTLAYGVPIIQHLIGELQDGNAKLKKPSALILTPTRELALQVKDHLMKLLDNTLSPGAKHGPIRIIALTGGMSIQKQRRLLQTGVQVIVATPGRLWDLISESTDMGQKLSQLDFLVLDEADRMIEGGHFAELDNIFKLTNRTKITFEDDFETAGVSAKRHEPNPNMRNYVFSATMSRELQRNLKKPKQKRRRLDDDEKGALGALGTLLDRMDFRDPDPALVDLLPEGGVVSTVKECCIDCLTSDKDVQLYHFLMMYPGKTLVFLSSIDGIRRLHPIFSQLNLGQVSVLHSSMQQKARMKSMERFQEADHAILLATDVASRGLDIPKVDHVVHFQLPRTSDTYIHRSGRTGRAGQSGVTLQLVAPEEKGLQREIMQSLGKDVKALATLPVEWSIISQLKTRIDLARQIDSDTHKVTKEHHDTKWLEDAAEAMEIDLDDLSSDDERRSLASKKASSKMLGLKAKLAEELRRNLSVHGVSARYITSGKGGQDRFVDSMLADKQHQNLIGRDQKTAFSDVQGAVKAPQRKGRKSKK